MTWPDIKPPKSKWRGGVPVKNEKHSGDRSLLIFDDRKDENVEAVYEPLVPIPEGGLRRDSGTARRSPDRPSW